MPILNPSIQCDLLQKTNEKSKIKPCMIEFFHTFLPIASHNIYNNFTTIEASIHFKNDLRKCRDFCKKRLKIKIRQNDLTNPSITNYYNFLYKKLIEKEKKTMKLKGNYFESADRFAFKFFQINTIENGFHSWFLSDTPIAVLCLNFKASQDTDDWKQIKLEVDLMEACGYKLVLCVYELCKDKDNLFKLIQEDQFLEIYYNVYNDPKFDCMKLFLNEYNDKYKFEFEKLKGYFYFNIRIDKSYENNERIIYKKLNKSPRVSVSLYTLELQKCFKSCNLTDTKPFAYCKNGFNYDYLRICLSNIPLYDSETDSESFIPSQISGIGIGYISKDDFLNWKLKRVAILYEDELKNNSLVDKYINFHDIHKIRTDLYATDQLAFSKIDLNTLKSVNKLKDTIKKRIKLNKEVYKKNKDYHFTNDGKIKEWIKYISYAYYKFQQKFGKKFVPHRTQIYTAYQACRRLKKIFKSVDNSRKDERGIVFQVETGEGKTFIICLIAAVLAKLGKTVHITSSNIELSIRDYEESFEFFKSINIKSAVLLHSNELSLPVRKKFKIDVDDTFVSDNKDQSDQKVNSPNSNDENNLAVNDINSPNTNDENNQNTNDKNNLTVNDINNQNTNDKNNSNVIDENNSSSEYEYDSYSDDEEKPIINNDVNSNSKESIFGGKEDSYFKESTKKTSVILNECYTEDYYGAKLFKNASRMNFSVCGLTEDSKEPTNKANVIFSTFVNFECFYLKMLELCPGSVKSYFSKCSLLMDEVDFILIDEIANGTIISRSMNSNAVEILKFVYEQKRNNVHYANTCKMIKNEEKWSNCIDLNEDHIKQMYEEIELIHNPEYENGKKYSIETKLVKNDRKKKRLFKETLEFFSDVTKDIMADFVNEFSKDNDGDDDDDEDDDDDDDFFYSDEEEEDMNDDTESNSQTAFNYIIPYGYDSNGMLGKNRVFGGFIQQFIAIKESIEKKVKNMIINDISMSYLYVSHPIFVKLYETVCGFTGTVGSKYDKDILSKQYGLTTKIVPRHNPNQNVEFPKILCKNIKERNRRILDEVLHFHEKGNPVLIIFQCLTEINEFEKLLFMKGIKSINIFDGKENYITPDEIAGINGAVTLGTNVCGRGTNIKAKGKPLHVIVSYFSSNIRAMNQAFGRTARQGQKGSYRVICLVDQYYSPSYINDINDAINEFEYKNHYQQQYVEYFSTKAKWIFQHYIDKQVIPHEFIKELRNIKINVNRIVAYKYKFPLCMSLETFLKIQEQKIFSLFNCPNSEFTWKIFQRYIRELILESWSLMINEFDREYYGKEKSIEYKKDLKLNKNNLILKLNNYFPRNCSIVQTYMHIIRIVKKKYESKIIEGLFTTKNKEKEKNYLLESHRLYLSIHVGFKPFSLYSKSGSRILSTSFKKTNFIQDPEIKYEQRVFKNKFSLVSITSKIDDLFEHIFQKINSILGSKTFLRLYLRRTMAGCEFGVCLNIGIKNKNKEFEQKNPYCFVDKDPLLLFTIYVRSMESVLAFILASLLVYLGVICSKIAKWFQFPSNVKDAFKKTATIVVKAFAKNISSIIIGKIIEFLENVLDKNIEQLRNYDQKNAEIVEKIKKIFSSSIFEKYSNGISNTIGSFFKITANWAKLMKCCIDPTSLLKISIYLLLLLASFILNYRCRKKAIADFTQDEETSQLTEECNEVKITEICENKENSDQVEDIKKISKKRKDKIDISYQECYQKFEFKMAICDIDKSKTKSNHFVLNKQSLIKKGDKTIIKCIDKSDHTQYYRISYSGNKEAFLQQVCIYLNLDFPSIIKFQKYDIIRGKQYIYIDYKEKGTLEDLILSKKEMLNQTSKLIIAYGISCAIEYLHQNEIIHRNLNPSNIFLDSNLYPYVSDFYKAIQTKTYFPYLLRHITFEYAAPEFHKDYKGCQKSFSLDVYAFAMVLFFLFFEEKPFSSYSNDIKEMVINIESNALRPDFPKPFPDELIFWKDLITRCWDQNDTKRPKFQQISKEIEEYGLNNENIDKTIFKKYKEEVLKRFATPNS